MSEAAELYQGVEEEGGQFLVRFSFAKRLHTLVFSTDHAKRAGAAYDLLLLKAAGLAGLSAEALEQQGHLNFPLSSYGWWEDTAKEIAAASLSDLVEQLARTAVEHIAVPLPAAAEAGAAATPAATLPLQGGSCYDWLAEEEWHTEAEEEEEEEQDMVQEELSDEGQAEGWTRYTGVSLAVSGWKMLISMGPAAQQLRIYITGLPSAEDAARAFDIMALKRASLSGRPLALARLNFPAATYTSDAALMQRIQTSSPEALADWLREGGPNAAAPAAPAAAVPAAAAAAAAPAAAAGTSRGAPRPRQAGPGLPPAKRRRAAAGRGSGGQGAEAAAHVPPVAPAALPLQQAEQAADSAVSIMQMVPQLLAALSMAGADGGTAPGALIGQYMVLVASALSEREKAYHATVLQGLLPMPSSSQGPAPGAAEAVHEFVTRTLSLKHAGAA